MNKNNPEKSSVRISSKAWLWFLSITLALAACSGRGGGDNVADVEAAKSSLPRLETPVPAQTIVPPEIVPPTISPARTKPAPASERDVRATPTG